MRYSEITNENIFKNTFNSIKNKFKKQPTANQPTANQPTANQPTDGGLKNSQDARHYGWKGMDHTAKDEAESVKKAEQINNLLKQIEFRKWDPSNKDHTRWANHVTDIIQQARWDNNVPGVLQKFINSKSPLPDGLDVHTGLLKAPKSSPNTNASSGEVDKVKKWIAGVINNARYDSTQAGYSNGKDRDGSGIQYDVNKKFNSVIPKLKQIYKDNPKELQQILNDLPAISKKVGRDFSSKNVPWLSHIEI